MRTFLSILSLLPATAFSQAMESDVLFAGNPAGSNSASFTSERLQSETAIAIAGQKIAGKLDVRFKKGIPTEIHFEESAGPASGSYEWKNGKLTTFANGKRVLENKPIEIKTRALFATHHYLLAASIYEEWLEQNQPSKMKITDISSLSSFDVGITVTQQTVQVQNGAISIDLMKLTVGGIELQYAIHDDKAVGFKVPTQMFEVVRKGYAGVFVDPLSKYPELSQPTFKVKTIKVAQTPMRDGAVLVSEIRRPEADGKYPTILARTPYGRNASALQYEFFAKRGYVVMSQDVRGRGGSGGGWDPMNSEVSDGYDTLEWITKQPWSDGNVGMIGGSYLGLVQWAAAVSHHPALKCIIPQVSPPDPLHNIPWDHGCFLLMGNVWWSRIVMNKDANMAAAAEGFANTKFFKTMPITQVDNALFKQNIPFYDKWISRTSIRDWPGAFRMDQISGVTIPVMHVSGTWDGDGIGTMRHYEILKRSKGNQWLIFGPWEHGFNIKTRVADQDYGPESVVELDSSYLRFFDTYLKSRSVKLEAAPRVRFFVTGSNKWFVGDEWPPKSAKSETMYLSGGNAFGAKSIGTLTAAKPNDGSDSYTYNPNTIEMPKSLESSPDGQKFTEKKAKFAKDALWYSSEKFKTPTVVGGPLRVDLCFKTTVYDAAVFVMAFDEDPNGLATLINLPGAMRVGFTGTGVEKLMPGKVYKITVEPWLFAREFKPGHRLSIAIGSDMFPKYARIPGTGEPDTTATRMLSARHTILKGERYPSKVTYWSFSASELSD